MVRPAYPMEQVSPVLGLRRLLLVGCQSLAPPDGECCLA